MSDLTAFVSMPVTAEFKNVSAAVMAALKESSYDVVRFDDMSTLLRGISWQTQIIDALSSADLVVADVTGTRGNIIYEIGFAHGQRKPVILIGQPNSVAALPGYLQVYQVLLYEPDDLGELDILLRRILGRLTHERES
jgi:hypothetical protein